ncbi:MAG: hypothetical protein COW30_00925 [Rhodospirillales bacterium CG15_BIG_FIL_POST_REV_8_21_14_020_66_15]|nr:MAG: hypothetical protein COW30_00925 [Rhodospirillales bacterium CG15_BIG_FIL_POST_REV_8_21_14_020_66_15]
MSRKMTTFRLDASVQAGLAKLSEMLHVSQNRLVNEALSAYIPRRMAEVEVDLEALLADLKAYRAQDPDFEKAIARVVEAETSGLPDPAEGQVVTGAAQQRLRALLNG